MSSAKKPWIEPELTVLVRGGNGQERILLDCKTVADTVDANAEDTGCFLFIEIGEYCTDCESMVDS